MPKWPPLLLMGLGQLLDSPWGKENCSLTLGKSAAAPVGLLRTTSAVLLSKGAHVWPTN